MKTPEKKASLMKEGCVGMAKGKIFIPFALSDPSKRKF